MIRLFMKHFAFRFIFVMIALTFNSCVQLPSFVIGDSSGIITYDRASKRLEVVWRNSLQMRDSTAAHVHGADTQDN